MLSQTFSATKENKTREKTVFDLFFRSRHKRRHKRCYSVNEINDELFYNDHAINKHDFALEETTEEVSFVFIAHHGFTDVSTFIDQMFNISFTVKSFEMGDWRRLTSSSTHF